MSSPVAYLCEHCRYMSLFGIVALLLIAYIMSSARHHINFRLVVNALIMQFLLAFFVIKTSLGRWVFQSLAAGFSQLYQFADAGTTFVFGRLSDPTGPWGLIFAVKVVPIIIFFGALMSLLFHLGIIQLCVRMVAIIIQPLLGTSGAETLCAAANSMLGQTEAPLLIKNYLSKMTESEILVVMVSGMGTLSGAILAVYGSMGVPMVHLISASVMAIPGSLLIAKILLPEQKKPETLGATSVRATADTKNILDAISRGSSDGMMLAFNVVAMLITFISLIALINFLLNVAHLPTLNDLFSYVFGPLAQLLGVSSVDAASAGVLLGQKLVINEFVAYGNMVTTVLSERTKTILTYALAGFSNFSCIGIQIGGIGALCPDKRHTLTRLGMKALLGGTLVNFLNAAIASLFI